MAPQKLRKRKSTMSTTSDAIEMAAPPSLIPTKLSSPVKTPTRSPAKEKAMKITAAQKQALIDNLQLEITERARRLRAQYALQAQGLRTRLEIRVHRIPPALRKRTIEEVLKEYEERNATLMDSFGGVKSNTATMSQITRASPQKVMEVARKPVAAPATISRGTKRPSTEVDTEADKENAAVVNPKKRARTAPISPEKPLSVPARLVLSPRSINAQALPPSPFKPLPPSPFKSQIARPISPLKPSVTVPTASSLAKATGAKVTKAKAAGTTRPTSRQGATSAASGTTRAKRGVPALAAVVTVPLGEEQQEDGRASSMSDVSAGTTVITKSTTSVASKKPTRIVQGRYTGPGAAQPLPPVTTTTTTTVVSSTTKDKETAKDKKQGIASKIAGIGAKAGRKVAGAAAAAAKVEAAAGVAAGASGVGGSVRGGRVLRKRV